MNSKQLQCAIMLPAVSEKLKQKYPNIQIRVHKANSKRRLVNLEKGKYDFAVVNMPGDDVALSNKIKLFRIPHQSHLRQPAIVTRRGVFGRPLIKKRARLHCKRALSAATVQ